MQTYQRLPVAFERGEGVWLWDEYGEQYLDAIGGIAVAILGHAHPEVAQALADQAATLIHTSNLYQIPLQEQLGKRLCTYSGMDRVFFANSGAEANEAAIKLARRYGHERNIANPAVVVMEGAFHGRTLATLTATGSRKAQAGFEPLVSGFKRVPYNDLDALRQLGHHAGEDVVAVLVEPILGEGGVVIPHAGYLRDLRTLCDEQGWLLCIDEVQTGMCRTGRWFAFQHEDIQPDVVTVAKALGNGVPIGACLARGAAAEILVPGTHGSTFGGNPLVCRAALTVLDVMERDRLAARAVTLGMHLLQALEATLGTDPRVLAIRGVGLMVGVELDRSCVDLVKLCLEQRLLINVTADKVIRLLPPLIMDETYLDLVVERLAAAFKQFRG